MKHTLTLQQFERLKPTFPTYEFWKLTQSYRNTPQDQTNVRVMETVLGELNPKLIPVNKRCPGCLTSMFKDLFEFSNFSSFNDQPVPTRGTTVTTPAKPNKTTKAQSK